MSLYFYHHRRGITYLLMEFGSGRNPVHYCEKCLYYIEQRIASLLGRGKIQGSIGVILSDLHARLLR